MAYDLKIMAAPRAGHATWEMDTIPWLRHSIPSAPDAFRSVDLTQGYRDSVAVLTAAELREWHERDRHRAEEPPYDDPQWQERLQPKIAELERVVENPPAPGLFVAWVYEWESGYS